MTDNKSLHISISPHIRSKRTTRSIMLDVLIALLPTSVAGCIIFGWRALLVIAATVAAAVLTEALYCVITKSKQTTLDLSAAVTGLLLALNLPYNLPIWQAVVGAIFAILFVKCLFGGIGKNFANPAITARVFMLVAFSSTVAAVAMPRWVPDTASSATPLASESAAPDLMKLFLGDCGGAIGEVCALALIVGGIYLVVRRVIAPTIPLCFVGTVFVFTLIAEGFDFGLALAGVLSGGLLIGAIFMATDYVTSPTTTLGKVIFATGAGLITTLIRVYSTSYPEGVSFAILFMNILTPYIDKLTQTHPFGSALKSAKSKEGE